MVPPFPVYKRGRIKRVGFYSLIASRQQLAFANTFSSERLLVRRQQVFNLTK